MNEPKASQEAETAATDTKKKELVKRAVAIHTGYVGTAFRGSTVNRALGEDATVEQVIETAIFKAGFMLATNYGDFGRTKWSRASRTDKGVHSLCTVMGLRMLVDEKCYQLTSKTAESSVKASSSDVEPDTVTDEQQDMRAAGATADAAAANDTSAVAAGILDNGAEAAVSSSPQLPELREGDTEGVGIADRINVHLPPAVRVFTVQKVNKKFDARMMCFDRTYEYYLPAHMLGMQCDGSPQDADILHSFRTALQTYLGSHPFHNYTRQRDVYKNAEYDKQKRQKRKQGKGANEGQTKRNVGPNHEQSQQSTGQQATGGQQQDTQQPAQQQDQGDGSHGTHQDQTAATGKEEEAQTNPQDRMMHQRGRPSNGSDDEDDGELDDDDIDMDVLQGPGQGATQTGGGDKQGGERKPQLRFVEAADSLRDIQRTVNRHIKSFTADDPQPLVPGGTPCCKLTVHGQSFMIHQIRHMIGTAVAVARGLISMELLSASLVTPTRMTLPRAPPHTLLLADCSFHKFPAQFGTGDNDLVHVTGPQLSLREQGTARKEAFRTEVLLPALEQLVRLPDWQQWLDSIQAQYPWPDQAQQQFLDAARPWMEAHRQKQAARQARRAVLDGEGGARGAGGQHEEGEEGRRGFPSKRQKTRGGHWGGRGRGRGRG